MKALASLTPEESKALIAKALWTLPEMKEAVRSGTVVIAADSTSVHVVREFHEGKAPEEPGPSLDVDGLLGRYLPLVAGGSWVIREGSIQREYDLLKIINGFQPVMFSSRAQTPSTRRGSPGPLWGRNRGARSRWPWGRSWQRGLTSWSRWA